MNEKVEFLMALVELEYECRANGQRFFAYLLHDAINRMGRTL